MGNRLFIVDDDQHVREMNEVSFKFESKLQEIVEKNPDLISREWSDQPRKLYLVEREQAIQATEDEGNTFFLDHLLVDSDGIPILVEVKRSKDTRIRREVAAQMLDYACRASSWDIEKLKTSFRRNNANRPDAEALFDDEEFWSRFSANLGAEHFRLVFVADSIPETLRILIEFMDRAMNNIEVYGVELKPYSTAEGEALLSSRIIGNSLNVRTKPTYSDRKSVSWTRESFLQRIRETMGDSVCKIAESMIEFCNEQLLTPTYGTGAKMATFNPKWNGKTVFCIGQDDLGTFVVEFDKSHLSAFGYDFNNMVARVEQLWIGTLPEGVRHSDFYLRINLDLLSDSAVYNGVKQIIIDLLSLATGA